MTDLSINVYVKRTNPMGSNAGSINLTPGDWVTGGTWNAAEPNGGTLFGERKGTFVVEANVAKLKGESGQKAIELKSFEPSPPHAGAGTVFQYVDEELVPAAIAWRTEYPWPDPS